MNKQAGQDAEQKALAHLTANGLKLVKKNYSCRMGEVDLIMREGIYLVFIEVRARTNTQFGGGIASITHTKRQKIIKTTLYYLMINQLQEKFPVRFDVVSIDGISGSITWIKDAFNAD